MAPSFPTAQSLPARFVNSVGDRYKSRVSLAEGRLLAEARRRTGLDDFGGTEFLAPMRVLLESLETEARLNLAGRVLTRTKLLRCLTNRLRIQRYLTQHPETLDVPLPAPVVITGFPRAGTTLLHRLMACDPENRVLRAREMFVPVSGGNQSSPPAIGCLIAAIRRRIGRAPLMSRRGRRRMRAIHDFSLDAPEECWPLFENTFQSEAFAIGAHAPRYMSYVADRDLTDAYRYYRRQIQILTAQAPPSRLVVKCPAHLGHLEEIVKVFPGARIIWCHRDPLAVLASSCSLVATNYSLRSDHVDPKEIGVTRTASALHRLRKGIAARDALGPEMFFDVKYGESIADPIGMVRRIYRFLDFPLTRDVEARLSAWMGRDTRQRRSLRHEYSPATFGLDFEVVQRRFREYSERFGVAVERPDAQPPPTAPRGSWALPW